MFVLYFPAARAGFVSDFTGWLDQIRNQSFGTYINRTNFKVVSMYQFTQLVTWVFYQFFGANAWLWHLLFITLHTINACLLYALCASMLRDAGVSNYKATGYIGSVLFCITPYISEVVVWEPSFHYLQGLLILLLIMRWVQQYIYAPSRKYILLVWVLYALSTHTLEVFYITPWFVLLLAIFYKYQTAEGNATWLRLMKHFFRPLLLIFILRLLEYRLLYGDWVSRIGSQTVLSLQDAGLGKPAKYLFHLLLLGRYVPAEWHLGSITMGDVRMHVYAFCDSVAGITLFYSITALFFAWGIFRYKYMSGKRRVALMLAAWAFIALLLITPLWFGDLLLVVYDRYTYFTAPFLFMFVAVSLSFIKRRYISTGIIVVLMAANLRYAIQAVRYWWKSSRITESLLQHLPAHDDKIIILLNLPDSMHGVLMIGSSGEGEYKLMRNLLYPQNKMKGKVYDAMSYNMATPHDGAHVKVLNDSTVRVMLNQYATWWWYEGLGGHDHENEDYKVRITGGDYELVMKQPASKYLLYYQTGSTWKQVDMTKTYEQY